jgi:rubrerythrin
MEKTQLTELLLQAYEHEKGGVLVYETALKCAVNEDLGREWSEYLDQTRNHVRVLGEALTALEIDLYTETPGRQVVRYLGSSLVQAMEMALTSAPREAAQLVACECVVNAETKDHLDWELIGKCLDSLDGQQREVLSQAYEQIEDEEDEHLYHSKGWCRELWLESLGLDAVLPPPEETEHVTSGVEAANVQKERTAPRNQ